MKTMEKSIKFEKGFLFIGWGSPEDNKQFEINRKISRGFLYQTVQYLNGATEIYRYRLGKEV